MGCRQQLRFQLAQVDYLGPYRLLQYEFVIRKRLIQVEFHDIRGNVVLLLRPRNLDLPGEVYALVIL